MRDFRIVLLIIGASLMLLGFIRLDPPPRGVISLPSTEWNCTDVEPEGCFEYRREHHHSPRGTHYVQ